MLSDYCLTHTGPASFFIGAKPNLYCEAMELVCGGSPKVCAQTNLDQLFIQHKCTFMNQTNQNYLQLSFSS